MDATRRSLVVAALLALVTAACGGGGNGGGSDGGEAATSVPEATTTAPPTTGPATGGPTTGPATTRPEAGDPCEADGLAEDAFVFNLAPTVGTTVTSGFTASGCANVFEATVGWRLEDGGGSELARGSATASCGTGCVGTYAFRVAYTVPGPTLATLLVFATSPRDGAEEHVNAIPLRLT